MFFPFEPQNGKQSILEIKFAWLHHQAEPNSFPWIAYGSYE